MKAYREPIIAGVCRLTGYMGLVVAFGWAGWIIYDVWRLHSHAASGLTILQELLPVYFTLLLGFAVLGIGSVTGYAAHIAYEAQLIREELQASRGAGPTATQEP